MFFMSFLNITARLKMSRIEEKLGVIAVALTMLGITSSPHPMILILCYGIHELGHLFFAKCFGAKMRKMRVGVFHLSMSYDCHHLSYPKELLVMAGGIIFNLASVAMAILIPAFSGAYKSFFVMCSLSLALMNLYPVSILDGGGILRSGLLFIMSQEKADRITKVLYFLFAVILWLIAVYLQLIFSSNISLFLVSVVLLVQLCFTF